MQKGKKILCWKESKEKEGGKRGKNNSKVEPSNIILMILGLEGITNCS